MKAMILAAGLGTRLRPLTLKKPKALVPVGNKPVINRVIQYLQGYGVNEIVVNAHHHPRQIVYHLDEGRPFNTVIHVLVEPEILGTGGGIKNAADFFENSPFIVVNSDILTNINLYRAYDAHRQSRRLATLILHDRDPFNQVQVDGSFNILDIGKENSPGRLAFTGIHVIEPELLSAIPEGVHSNIIDCYRELIRSGKPMNAWVSTGHDWRDIGTVGSYIQANKDALGKYPVLLGPGHRIHSTARIKDWAVIGENVRLEEGVEIRRSILWEEVRIKKGRKVIDSIVTSSNAVARDLIDSIL
jgi:mannose-1-phosphate guanylyltransferase